MNLNRVLTFAVALLAFNLTSVQAADDSAAQEWQIKAEINQLAHDYAIYRDSLNAEGYASVFAEDGKFLFRGNVFQGRDVLRKRIEAADPNQTSMHIMSSSQISMIDDRNATGVHYVTVYSKARDSDHKEGETLKVANFSVMGIYTDKYRLTEEGWKIAERSMQPVFSPME